jgi:hypothetical protein
VEDGWYVDGSLEAGAPPPVGAAELEEPSLCTEVAGGVTAVGELVVGVELGAGPLPGVPPEPAPEIGAEPEPDPELGAAEVGLKLVPPGLTGTAGRWRRLEPEVEVSAALPELPVIVAVDVVAWW